MKKFKVFLLSVLVFLFTFGLCFADFPNSADRIEGTVAFGYYEIWHATPSVDGYWARWNDTGHNPEINDIMSMYWPLGGLYSNGNYNIYSTHAYGIKRAHLDAVIIGWGNAYQGEFERLKTAVIGFHDNGLKSIVAIYPKWSGEEWDSLINRLDTLISYITNYPNYFFHSNGKPVIMIGHPDRDDLIYNPDQGDLYTSWKHKIHYYKTNKDLFPNGVIFIAADCQLDWLKDSYWDGWFWSGVPSDEDGVDHLNYNIWKLYTIDDYNRFYIQTIIAGFDTRANCHDFNPIVRDRENGELFKRIWGWVKQAQWNGYKIDHCSVPINDHGECANIYPADPNPPMRGNGYQSCGGRVPQYYFTYEPLDPWWYIDENARQVDEFKATR